MKKNIIFGLFVFVFIALSSSVFADSFLSIELVNQDPDPATAGNFVDIRIGVENTASMISEDMVLELFEEFPFSVAGGESTVKEVGTLDSYQSGDNYKILKFRVLVDKDAKAGEYDLNFWQFSKNNKDDGIKKSITIDLKTKESAEIIRIDKTDLLPGKMTPLKFAITNVGSAPLRDISFSWINEDGIILPVGSDNTQFIKYMEIGETVEIEYNVIADSNADAGLYKLDLSLSYEDSLDGDVAGFSTVAGIYVGGITDFDIAFSEISNGEVAFSVANIGSNPASSVSVIVPEQQGWTVSGSNSRIIGNLNVGDYTVASFGLQSSARGNVPSSEKTQDTSDKTLSREDFLAQRNSGSPQNSQNSLKMQVAYTDTMGNRNIVEKNIAMKSQNLMSGTFDFASAASGTSSGTMAGMRSFGMRQQQESFFSKYKWYIISLTFIAVAFLFNSKFKKKKILEPKLTRLGFFKSFFKRKGKKR